ncbi:MAG TPA: serine hydrolase domain-containing protein, partial [Thermoanaerobaculia bacterium]|nr:serine hydrolase domain-containing protein [Thermoanaerobaculia bacterium]
MPVQAGRIESTAVTTRAAVVAGLILLAPGTVTYAAEGAPEIASIRRFVERQMRVSRLPAVALAVVRPEQEIYAAVLSRESTDLTPDTPFLLGSVTKTITALAIAQLADAGKLQFDDAVSKHLPGFALNAGDGGRTITLRQLLTHTSGLRQWSGHDRRAQREGRFDHIAPARPPGTRFEYSSLNYMILGKVVEAASGMPYGEYVRAHIFEPLDMGSSFTDLESAREKGLVRGHWYAYGLAIPGQETQQPEPLVPAGFLISSARDLGHYLSMLLNEGRFRGRQVVSREALGEMFRTWDGGATGAGMAWGIGSTRIGHAGSTPTFSARLALLPEARYGIVILTNVNSGPFFPGTAAVMDGVSRIMLGEDAEPARPDEILLKVGILILVIVGAIRTFSRFRHWSQHGFPHRLSVSRRVALPLVKEAAAAAIVLFV